MQRLIFTAYFLCIVFGVVAQRGDQYTFKHYTTASGLISSQVFSTVQDDKGFIWIGSTDGLQRFDGVRYVSFRHDTKDTVSIPSNPISQLFIDYKRRLWLLLFDGTIGIFDTRKFTFSKKRVQTKTPGATKAEIKRLIPDEDGNIFFLMQGIEVITWSEQYQEFSYKHNFFKLPAAWKISSFAHQPGTKKYWFSLQGGGMAIYNYATGFLSSTGNNLAHEPALDKLDTHISAVQMLFDQKGRLWFYWWQTVFPYVYCYDLKKDTYQRFELLSQLRSYHEVHDFFEQRDGTIWARGVNVFAKFIDKDTRFELVQNGYTNEHGIAFESVTCLSEDRSGNMWVATGNNGLYTFNPSRIYFENISHHNRILNKKGSGSPMSFIKTKWGTILCGTWEDGLYQYNNALEVIPTNIKGINENGGPFIWNMFASSDSNTIWMASQPGIYALDQEKRSVSFYNPAVLQNRTVRQIAEDKNRNLWLGMQNYGLFKWTISNSKAPGNIIPEKINSIPDDNINKLMTDKNGMLWVASAQHGVYVIDPSSGALKMHFTKSPGKSTNEIAIPEDDAISVLEYNDSLVLISLLNSLVIYNRHAHRATTKYTTGTFSGYIASMEKDTQGFVWLSTTSGLYRLGLQGNILLNFRKEDGIQNEIFITGGSAKLPDGRLLFAGSNQFIAFKPDEMQFDTIMPTIAITGFEVMNKPVNVDSILAHNPIQLHYDENAITILFSTMTFDNNYLVQYQLDGLDKEWTTADNRKQASYSYLPPGQYTLHFRTMNWKGIFEDSSTVVNIHIKPAFWQSWWFFSILALIAGGFLFWLDKERSKRKLAVETMRNNIAGNLHKDINTALNNINILSEMAWQKTDTEPQKSKEFIEQIHTKSHNMIIAMDDMLWSISPENDSMEKTVDRMQEYIDALNNRHNVHIEMLVDEKIISLKLNMQFRHEAFWLFKESILGLVNAGISQAKIHVALEKNNLLYTIQFNNEYSNMQQLNNLLQRQDVLARLENIKAKRNIQLHRSHSLLEIKVPVGK